ncbi:hypothetical protein [Halorubrum lacusprofundi]|jgi:hypothetical protein|uniref:Uncharacterized protein n=1 Tax=Halorubrum lacusprofundi TaxID=2247 RepID=A0A220SX23_9EURY|nr:hypothetical protein [Halorubrum lacusprofundi]ASK38284.1 hypothetical protein [Halorubrum lacusprofundi]
MGAEPRVVEIFALFSDRLFQARICLKKRISTEPDEQYGEEHLEELQTDEMEEVQ